MLRLSVSCDFETPGSARDFLFAVCQEMNAGKKSGIGWLLSEPGELADEECQQEEKQDDGEASEQSEVIIPHVDVIQDNPPAPHTPDGVGDAPMPWEKKK